MKKKLGITLVLLVVAGSIFAYYHHKQTKMNEFMTYYNEIWVPTAATEEEKIGGNLDRVEELEDKDKMKEIAGLVEEESLPVAKRGLKQFRDINPENGEIKKMNNLTIEVEKQRIELIETIIAYGEGKQHEQVVRNAEEELRKKAKKATDYAQTLIEKYGLKKDATDKIYGIEKVKPE